jgi:hypothetical protein
MLLPSAPKKFRRRDHFAPNPRVAAEARAATTAFFNGVFGL